MSKECCGKEIIKLQREVENHKVWLKWMTNLGNVSIEEHYTYIANRLDLANALEVKNE